MARIDTLIADAQKALEGANDDEKAAAQARLDALKSVKLAGVEMDNDEVNGLLTRKLAETDERWKGVVGMEREEAETIFRDLSAEGLEGLFSGTEDDEGEGDDTPTLKRITEAFRDRDRRLEQHEEARNTLARDLYSERVENRLKEALRAKGLKDERLELARRLSGEGDLVEKLMKGESLEGEAFSKIADDLHGASPEWFKSAGEDDAAGNGDGTRTIAGVKVREDGPGIPATPSGKEAGELTHEDREAGTTSPY